MQNSVHDEEEQFLVGSPPRCCSVLGSPINGDNEVATGDLIPSVHRIISEGFILVGERHDVGRFIDSHELDVRCLHGGVVDKPDRHLPVVIMSLGMEDMTDKRREGSFVDPFGYLDLGVDGDVDGRTILRAHCVLPSKAGDRRRGLEIAE